MMAKGSKCKWGNWIGYIVFPFSIALRDDPLEHLRKAKWIVDRKKNSFGAALTFIFGNFILKLFGVKVSLNNKYIKFDAIRPKHISLFTFC